MSRIVYVNGAYVPEEEATISIFDRGFLMADGVYEVTSVLGGKLMDYDGHYARLVRSRKGLDTARQLDEDGNLYALAGFLLYGTFDPRPFPNLMAHLKIHGNETGHVTEVPYRCFREATTN